MDFTQFNLDTRLLLPFVELVFMNQHLSKRRPFRLLWLDRT